MGVAPRILSGWMPTPDDPSPWNQNQREMMFALVEAENDICPGCGSFLSFSTRRDHALDVTRRQCEHCAAIHEANKQWDDIDEKQKGTTVAWEPSARRIDSRPVPLAPETIEGAKLEGIDLGPRKEE